MLTYKLSPELYIVPSCYAFLPADEMSAAAEMTWGKVGLSKVLVFSISQDAVEFKQRLGLMSALKHRSETKLTLWYSQTYIRLKVLI